MITRQHNDLTQGPILKGLVTMAMPIMATSFIQMAYNLTDMIWIGFLGSGAVAAVGIAGFFIWLSQAFVFLGKTGTEIKVAQATVFCIFFYNIRYKHSLFEHFVLFKKNNIRESVAIMRMGFPPALQSALFTMISMVIARIIANYGALPIAVQKVGSQIESITWMTALGFSVALGTFVGQNFSASQYSRVITGYRTAMRVAFGLGLFNTFLLFFGAKWLFMIFIREPEAIVLGVDYLRILALSQLFMCIEITSSGAFNGIGRTEPAAITSIVFNLLRIPMALYFSQMTFLGLNGIWWSITISSIFKGVIVYIWFGMIIKNRPEFRELEVA